MIDDTAAITLVAASTLTAEIREELNGKGGDKVRATACMLHVRLRLAVFCHGFYALC